MKETILEKGTYTTIVFGVGLILGIWFAPYEKVTVEEKIVEVQKPKNEIFEHCYVQSVRLLGKTEDVSWGEYRYTLEGVEPERLKQDVDYCVANYY